MDFTSSPREELPASPGYLTPNVDVRVAGAPLTEAGADGGRSRRRRLIKIGAVAAAAVVVVGGGTAGAMAMTGGSDKDTVAPAPLADAARNQPSEAELKAAEERRLKLAAQRASRDARKDSVKRPALALKGTPLPSKTPESDSAGDPPPAGNPVPAGEAQRIAKAMLPEFGFNPATQFGCLVKLWDKESGWRVTAANPSGAYGIPQALPGSKMATAGADWRTSAATQIKWGLGYIKSRYDTPCGGWAAFNRQGWY
ncbi:lytic transglycosylase domain-containing protein [Actinomadura alba]|uniref:Lytic transglycosylase domain-containing protein n=1 Tax=Actinomadura alba TaxID=406431 RepID=A0ABR7LR35_9ACTN|nr:lytic transglycosylase domain-containing protein [Actinomadura alba]MBC6467133.1 lytic transglycosylase domain-containing protein [Actinomadura alba]